MQDSQLKPFVTKPSGPVFILLNILRLISIISLLLVFAANIVTMANDIKAIKASPSSSVSSSSSSSSNTNSSSSGHNSTSSTAGQVWDCDYVEYSTVPDQTGGAFWSILNRLFIIFECILLTLSEIGFPKRLFEDFIPVLGPAHGLGGLGVFEALIGAQVLSHYCDLFPQVASWLLFIVGCFNIVAGMIFRSSAKGKRLVFSWENVSQLTPQTRLAATAWDMVTEKSNTSPFNRNPQHPNSSSDASPIYPKRANPHAPSTRQPSESSTNTNSRSAGNHPDHQTSGMTEIPLSRPSTNHSDTPLLPPTSLHSEPGSRFGGFGFGRQGEKRAEERGWKISKPVESLPRYAF